MDEGEARGARVSILLLGVSFGFERISVKEENSPMFNRKARLASLIKRSGLDEWFNDF